MKQQSKVFYVISSHWDREWYLPFQDYRHKLVRLIDQVLGDLNSGTLGGPFTCDGQAILIEDYLEIRPEREAEIRARIGSGAVVVGPWYVLPDEFLVSGESLLRNLRIGRGLVRAFGGEPSEVGFLCDLFGHNSQMPQILAGFGIHGAMVWRGVDIRMGGRFIWEGADGTRLPTYRFGKSGYCDYTYKVRHSTDETIHFDPEQAEADLLGYIKEERERLGEGVPVLVFDGGDHLLPDRRHYSILRSLKEEDGGDTVVHGTLDGFMECFVASFDGTEPLLRGELREPTRWPTTEDQSFLIPGCLASRVWIKQENAALESLLCDWVEPFAAWCHLTLGTEHPDGFLTAAWRWLLQNHPHDSICGCSVDQVHEDMKYRFSQCRQIGERLMDEALRAVAAAESGTLSPRERRLAIFNPQAEVRSGIVEFEVEVPCDWPEFTEFFGYEPKPAFRLFHCDREVPYQRLATRRFVTRKRVRDLHYPKPYQVHVVRVAAELELPPLGFLTLRLQGIRTNGNGADHLGNRHVPATRHPSAPGLRCERTAMENRFLWVAIQSDGGLTIEDKATGQSYHNLNLFEDDADIGDGWYHGPVVNRRDVLSGGVQIELLCDTPLVTSYLVRHILSVPAVYDGRSDARSEDRQALQIESRVTLRADASWVDIETRVDNVIRDHRLRALFPTGTLSDTYLADAPFDVVERPVALRRDNHLYREVEVETRPQQSWTAISDGNRGLAVVSGGGLLETAVLDRRERPIALTLFRATQRTKMTDGESGGQMIGIPLVFRYRLIPFAGEPDRFGLFRHAKELAAGIRVINLDQRDLDYERGKSGIENRFPDSFLSVSGGAVLTSLRQVGEGTELRVFNPWDREIAARIRRGPSLRETHAERVNFESEPTDGSLATEEGEVVVKLRPKEICSVRMV